MDDLTKIFRMGPGGEGAHWYAPSPDGALCAYQIEMTSKPGQWRDCNLRDARKHNLYPSVSKINGQLDKPGLTRWLCNQFALATKTCPGLDEIKDEASWLAAVREDANAQSKKAREFGTAIHASVENAIETHKADSEEHSAFQSAAFEALEEISGEDRHSIITGQWRVEEAVTSHWGYGGRVDCYHPDGFIVDFKSSEFDAEKAQTMKVYPEQGRALAAYREALGMPDTARCFNVFLSRDHPGLWKVIEHPLPKLAHYLEDFLALTYRWQVESKVERLALPGLK